MQTAQDWMEGVGPATLVAEAGARALKGSLGEVGRLARGARRGTGDPAKTVHQLRVATRRAAAVLEAFRPWLEGRAWTRAQKLLRRMRHRAGAVRDIDVRTRMFAELRAGAHGPPAAGLAYLIARVERDRDPSERRLNRLLRRTKRSDLHRLARRLAERLRTKTAATAPPVPPDDSPAAGGPTLAEAGRVALPALVSAARAAMAADLSRIENVHTLRKAMKRLRYGLEPLAPGLDPAVVHDAQVRLASVQTQMGDVNDSDSAARWIAGQAAELCDEMERGAVREGIEALAERYRVLRDHRLARFLNAGGLREASEVLDRLGGVLAARGAALEEMPPRGGTPDVTPDAVRLAAIDVGSNSTRLVVAEARPDGSYRVLDDERELTRLAHGLVETGRLEPIVMDRAASTIARLRGIAAGYGCRVVRAVATAAVREAENGADFVAMVRERAGLDLRVISAEEEASLAFLSASRAFGDLRTLSAGVIDIGGASTEVILSSRGVVEGVAALPLGAVRLTERFGQPDEPGAYKKMREFVRETVRERVESPAIRPEILVGTGGTVTTLAAIAMHAEPDGPPGGELASPQGYQLRLETISGILDDLRELPLEKRRRVPGLPSERADIIVAGIAVIEAVMRRLGATRLRVHERGVRDGVLLQAIREVFPGAAPRAGRGVRLEAARRLARACRAEEIHSEHVARLALKIFDGLAPLIRVADDLWSGPWARELLEAGAVLHDIGYIVSYAKHHRHAYHLILHADALTEGAGAFTRREVQIIACLARYHRRADPADGDPELAGLSEDDLALTRRLIAVLRIADGLDRTHSQNVKDLRVRLEHGAAVLEIDAQGDPATDLWAASRKSALFEDVFGLKARFAWPGARRAALRTAAATPA